MKNFDKKLESFIFNKHSVKLDNIQKNTIISIKEMLEESFFISGIKKILLKKKNGIYFYGNVGRGKSLICHSINSLLSKKSHLENFPDLIFNLQKLETSNKAQTKKKSTTFPKIKMLIIDELQVDNIADIHILLKFMKSVKRKKIFLIFISNRSPSTLYKTVQENKFVKEFKNFFSKNYYILKNESKKDYRQTLRFGEHFFFSNPEKNNAEQDTLIRRIIKNSTTDYHNVVDGSNIKLKLNKKFKLIDCEFEEICSTFLSNKEYKIISQNFDYIIIRNIPKLDEDKKDSVARFISLIDNIYDKKGFLSIASKFRLSEIFKAKTKKFEFERTLSRLIEMGSQKYVSNIL